MIERPVFSTQLSVDQFKAHYWYKEELQTICRTYGLSASGTKVELEERIISLLSGNLGKNDRVEHMNKRKSKKLEEITLKTKLIPDGFKFNQKAREFFANYYKKDKFSFTKEMAAALRDAERRGDMEITVADLIEVYEGKREIQNKEEKTYEWNYFVKDFNQDSRSGRFGKDRMRVASQLWKKVRDMSGEKQYKPELLDEYLREHDHK